MKLYNLLEDIIFEDKRLLTEIVSKSQINDSLDSHKRVRIYYQGAKETRPEVRYIDVYAYGVSTAGNEVLRVYQAFGTTTSNIGWKLLRTDRISGWEPTGFRFSEKALDSDPSIPTRNQSGDNSMATIYKVARFNNDSNTNNDVNVPINKQDRDIQTIQQNKPINKVKSEPKANTQIQQKQSIEPKVANAQVKSEPNNKKQSTELKPSRYEY